MPNPRHQLPASSHRLLIVGQLLILAGLSIFCCAMIYEFVISIKGGEEVDRMIKENFVQQSYEGSYPRGMRLLSATLLPLSSITGILAMVFSLRLFGAYRRGEIFTSLSARRLRIIGWLIVLIAPIDMFVRTLGIAIYSAWAKPGKVNISAEFSEGEVYALVFGLLIVIVAQVMVKAIEISEENEAIV